MKVLIFLLILLIPSVSVGENLAENVSKYQPRSYKIDPGTVLITIGILSLGIGAFWKWDEEEYIDEFGDLQKEKKYHMANYAVMSTGGSCILVGIVLNIMGPKDRIALQMDGKEIRLAASISF